MMEPIPPASLLVMWYELARQLALQVRPEFLQDIRSGIKTQLHTVSLGIIREAAAVRVVCIRDSQRSRTAHHLGIIELMLSRIGSGDEKPADRIAQSRTSGAIAAAEVARVLMQ